jgi:hypothetical protein
MKFLFHPLIPVSAGIVFADITPQVPFNITGSWLLGLIGCLSIIYLILGVWSSARKLFGRRPPIDEDIARLQASMKIELEKQTTFLTRRIDEVHQNTEELRLERERTWKAFQAQISELGQQFAYLSGALGHKPKR